jgi:hypothetical protein
VAESDLSAATASMVDYYNKEVGKTDDYSKTVTNTVTIEEVRRAERKE